jgi:hypothetical protein
MDLDITSEFGDVTILETSHSDTNELEVTSEFGDVTICVTDNKVTIPKQKLLSL